MMHVVTDKIQALSVPKRWARQYGLPRHDPAEKGAQTAALLALEPPTPEAVEKIIGNLSWTTIVCRGCDESVRWAVRIPEGEDAIDLCRACIAALGSFL